MRFKHNRSSLCNINYHIIWTPKYRKSYLIGQFKKLIEESLMKKSKDLNIEIKCYEIMPDHIHLFISANPKYKIFKSFWSRGYYCESIGHISEKVIVKYIEDQWKVYNANSSQH